MASASAAGPAGSRADMARGCRHAGQPRTHGRRGVFPALRALTTPPRAGSRVTGGWLLPRALAVKPTARAARGGRWGDGVNLATGDRGSVRACLFGVHSLPHRGPRTSISVCRRSMIFTGSPGGGAAKAGRKVGPQLCATNFVSSTSRGCPGRAVYAVLLDRASGPYGFAQIFLCLWAPTKGRRATAQPATRSNFADCRRHKGDSCGARR